MLRLLGSLGLAAALLNQGCATPQLNNIVERGACESTDDRVVPPTAAEYAATTPTPVPTLVDNRTWHDWLTEHPVAQAGVAIGATALIALVVGLSLAGADSKVKH